MGKTASVSTISHMMAEGFQKRVLMVELDPQMNMTNLYSEIDFIELFHKIRHGMITKTKPSIEDILLDKDKDIHECIVHTAYAGLDLLPSYLTLSEAEERLKADVRTPQQFRFKAQLEKVATEYDVCMIDASPSLSILNINGLAAADEVYIPVRCDGNSLVGVSITMNLIGSVMEYNPRLSVGGMFFTQWNGRKNIAKAVYQLMEDEYAGYLLPFNISSSKSLEECSVIQKPLLTYDSKLMSKATEEYHNLTEYLLAPNKEAFLKGIRVYRSN